jgi:signal transduction histidine kinase
VDVIATQTALSLKVSDDGIGFDVEQSRLAPGIGLISMRERMRLIDGLFEIRSQPGKGTNITCRAPLTPSETTQTSNP